MHRGSGGGVVIVAVIENHNHREAHSVCDLSVINLSGTEAELVILTTEPGSGTNLPFTECLCSF